MKKLCRLIPLILIALFVLSACTAAPKTFEAKGLSITLTEDFERNDDLNNEQDAVFMSNEALVTVLCESFNQLAVDDSFTEADYAELVCLANDMNVEVKDKDGYTYFVYESTVDGDDFKYLAVIFKGDDAFYMVQFCTFADGFSSELDDFWAYADTVEIS